MDEATKNLWEVLIAGGQLVVVLLTGIWAYRRFRAERPHQPRIELRLDCVFHGPEQGGYLAEFIIRANNRGLIVHRFHSIRLRVRGIRVGSAVQPWRGHEPRVAFPEKLIPDAEVLHKPKFDHIFVEPGVQQTITYAAMIPGSFRFIAARVEFYYDFAREWPHSAERVFTVGDRSGAA